MPKIICCKQCAVNSKKHFVAQGIWANDPCPYCGEPIYQAYELVGIK